MTDGDSQTLATESLAAALDRVHRSLAGRAELVAEDGSTAASLPADADWHPFDHLRALFGLSSFERDLLVLCTGYALEGRFVEDAAAAARGGVTRPTFGLALSTLDDPHWSAVTPSGPIRYWRLVELGDGSLLDAPLQLDDRVLQYILGVPAIDGRLQPLVRPIALPADAHGEAADDPRRRAAVVAGARHWGRLGTAPEPLLLIGRHRSTCERAFARICSEVGLRPFRLDSTDIPDDPVEREQLARLWTREATLAGAGLCLGAEHCENPRNVSAWLEQVFAPVAVDVRPGSAVERLDGLRIHIEAISPDERAEIWRQSLGPLAHGINGTLDRIVEYFDFEESAIRLSAARIRDQAEALDGRDLDELSWHVCREHGRRSLESLAHRIEPGAGWDDLVLPHAQLETLRQIPVHMRRRELVNHRWGFAAKHARGLGLTVLFTGSSGTGKTMAAEILAAELDLDLYRVDLASVVSKYIGETEKNLRAIFEGAEQSGAILLFDEADALFGKRSEVRDSHDRYANLEISYLLQQMEAYHGVAILTTNMQHALDPAFMRRIRFVIQFPFPDHAARAQIWRGIFPASTPLAELDFEQLAQLNVSGGAIRNIATNAAFLAADDTELVETKHILAAARTEYAKLDKPLTPAETRGMS
jgi:hypothetical protein